MTLDPHSLDPQEDWDFEDGPPYPLFGMDVQAYATAVGKSAAGPVEQGDVEAASAVDHSLFAA